MVWFVIIGIIVLIVGSIAINTGKDSQDLAGGAQVLKAFTEM
ncbi:hypothetical protein [uncultured Lutibacter sp.]|nr:hypothetical protein [uncultured Lutibacter sp.]